MKSTKTTGILISVLLLLLIGGANGQDASPTPAKPPLPPGPLIQKRAPEFSQWMITLKAPGDKEKDDGTGAVAKGNSAVGTPKYVVTKTGKLIRIQFVDDAKQVWNLWYQGGTTIAVWPDHKNVGFAARPTAPDSYNPLYMDFSQSDFQGFDWISTGNYSDIKEVMGKKCIIFNSKQSGGSGNAAPDETLSTGIVTSANSAAFAYIDLDTRLPVALSNQNGIYVYQFQTPPTVMQTVPPEVKELVDQENQAIQAVARRPSVPY